MQYLKIPLTLFQGKDSFYHNISVLHGKEREEQGQSS